MDAAAEALGSGAPGADDDYAAALDRWLALGGADLEERAGAVADDVGLGVWVGRVVAGSVTLDMPMTALSGGQAARAAGAAAVALRRPPARRAHERPRPRRAGSARAVRHRLTLAGRHRQPRPECLARTVNRIVELDLAQQQVGVYEGGYDSYLAERAVARRHAREAYEEYDDKRGALKDRAVMQRNWMAQGVRNARRKATDRTSTSRPSASRPARSRPRRPGRPSGRSSGWRSSRSRARSGSCG